MARVAVAYSGGRDSTALLHATVQAASSLGIEVVALHVHHGLSPNADAWLEHCRWTCDAAASAGHRLTFASARVAGRPAKGESVEAWARKARYAALRAMAVTAGASLVLLAHHRRDQAETLLLQALRGSGVAGLAGMPKIVERDGLTWARPWLGVAGAAIDAYVERHRLAFIEDESNANLRFDRNRLRRRVWPPLLEAFPQAETALAAAAGWAHEATSAMAEFAAVDLGATAADGRLRVAAWSALSPARRRNALRAWLKQRIGTAPGATLVARLMAELPACLSARWPLAGGELRCHRGVLDWHRQLDAPARSTAPETVLSLSRAGTYPLPGWNGALRATRARAGGIALSALGRLDLIARSGAEQFQAGPGRPPRSLKKQYQAAGLPAWQRGGPLLYSAGRLVFVPGLGIDARCRAPAGEPQMTLDWIASSTPS